MAPPRVQPPSKEDIDGAIQLWIFLACVLLAFAAAALYLNGWHVTGILVGVIAGIGYLLAESGIVWWRRSQRRE
jgi:hypothetical protein